MPDIEITATSADAHLRASTEAPWDPFAAYGRIPPNTGQTLTLERPAGGGVAWLIAHWAATIARDAPQRPQGAGLLVVTESALDAQRLADEIGFYAEGLRVRLLPDWETLPYEAFSPHQDLISDRLLALYESLQGRVDVLVVSAATSRQRICPPSLLAANTFFIKPGQPLRLQSLREQLRTTGYNPVSQVVSSAE